VVLKKWTWPNLGVVQPVRPPWLRACIVTNGRKYYRCLRHTMRHHLHCRPYRITCCCYKVRDHAYTWFYSGIYLNYSRQCPLDRLHIVSVPLTAITLSSRLWDCSWTSLLCLAIQSTTVYLITYAILRHLWIISDDLWRHFILFVINFIAILQR